VAGAGKDADPRTGNQDSEPGRLAQGDQVVGALGDADRTAHRAVVQRGLGQDRAAQQAPEVLGAREGADQCRRLVRGGSPGPRAQESKGGHPEAQRTHERVRDRGHGPEGQS
jgi:hypothetical protein